MNLTLATDHPAWHLAAVDSDDTSEARTAVRVVRSGGELWSLAWGSAGIESRCLAGSAHRPPTVTRTSAIDLPARTPGSLRQELAALGAVHRVANPWLWDAITTAVLRQVVRAAQARALYSRWCTEHGGEVSTPARTGWTVPGPELVLQLPDSAFAAVGASFHRTALQAAAAAYLTDGEAWEQLAAGDLVDALCRVPRIGPWTARAAAADFTGDFRIYPHGDLAVRTWAARAAHDIAWPAAGRGFDVAWRALADTDDQLHTLTALTLAWGSHARSPAAHRPVPAA